MVINFDIELAKANIKLYKEEARIEHDFEIADAKTRQWIDMVCHDVDEIRFINVDSVEAEKFAESFEDQLANLFAEDIIFCMAEEEAEEQRKAEAEAARKAAEIEAEEKKQRMIMRLADKAAARENAKRKNAIKAWMNAPKTVSKERRERMLEALEAFDKEAYHAYLKAGAKIVEKKTRRIKEIKRDIELYESSDELSKKEAAINGFSVLVKNAENKMKGARMVLGKAKKSSDKERIEEAIAKYNAAVDILEAKKNEFSERTEEFNNKSVEYAARIEALKKELEDAEKKIELRKISEQAKRVFDKHEQRQKELEDAFGISVENARKLPKGMTDNEIKEWFRSFPKESRMSYVQIERLIHKRGNIDLFTALVNFKYDSSNAWVIREIKNVCGNERAALVIGEINDRCDAIRKQYIRDVKRIRKDTEIKYEHYEIGKVVAQSFMNEEEIELAVSLGIPVPWMTVEEKGNISRITDVDKAISAAYRFAKLEFELINTPVMQYNNHVVPASMTECQMTHVLGYTEQNSIERSNIMSYNELFKYSKSFKHDELDSAEYKDKLAQLDEIMYTAIETFVCRTKGHGVTMTIHDKEIKFKPLLRSPGEAKKANIRMVCYEDIEKYPYLFNAGGMTAAWLHDNVGKYVYNKVDQIFAFCTTNAVPFERIFGRKVTVENIVFIDERKDKVKALPNTREISVDDEGNYNVSDAIETVEVNPIDGWMILAVPEALEKDDLVNVIQARIYGCKSMTVVTSSKERLAEGHDVPEFIVDHWNNKENFWDKDKLGFCDTSVCKVAKFFKTREEFYEFANKSGLNEMYVVAQPEYEEAYKVYGDGYTMYSSKSTVKMYRQLLEKMFVLTPDDVEELIRNELEEVKSIMDYDVHVDSVINSGIGYSVIQSEHPEFAMFPVNVAKTKEKFLSARNNIAQSSFRVKGCEAMMAPDLDAAFDYLICGMNIADIKSGLPAGTIACEAIPAKRVAVVRAPFNGNKAVEAEVVRIYRWKGNCVFFNIKDSIVVVIDGDYDGDHAQFIWEKIILDAVRKLAEKVGYVVYGDNGQKFDGKISPDIKNDPKLYKLSSQWIVLSKIMDEISEASTMATRIAQHINYKNYDTTVGKVLTECYLIASAYCQFAVDSTKLGKKAVSPVKTMNKIVKSANIMSVDDNGEEYQIKTIFELIGMKGPYTNRFRDNNAVTIEKSLDKNGNEIFVEVKHPNWDKEFWDERTEIIGDNPVDIVASIVENELPHNMKMQNMPADVAETVSKWILNPETFVSNARAYVPSMNYGDMTDVQIDNIKSKEKVDMLRGIIEERRNAYEKNPTGDAKAALDKAEEAMDRAKRYAITEGFNINIPIEHIDDTELMKYIKLDQASVTKRMLDEARNCGFISFVELFTLLNWARMAYFRIRNNDRLEAKDAAIKEKVTGRVDKLSVFKNELLDWIRPANGVELTETEKSAMAFRLLWKTQKNWMICRRGYKPDYTKTSYEGENGMLRLIIDMFGFDAMIAYRDIKSEERIESTDAFSIDAIDFTTFGD